MMPSDVRENLRVTYFLDEFAEALYHQLVADEQRWGKTWLERPRKGQEDRISFTIDSYFQEYFDTGKPVPWLKIAGNAMIAWLRENHPEIWSE